MEHCSWKKSPICSSWIKNEKKKFEVFFVKFPPVLLIVDVFKPVAPPKKEYYKALYEFEPRNPDEMALDEGDIVVVSLCNVMLCK